ncbi:hypothetical protein ABT093_21440 [Kitasatospora sp. NPDC002551]|uniref:hypothetical protein n=1 Tax=unclassified Kitasatospora TaxID=2633591 RepID=UPI0033206C94
MKYDYGWAKHETASGEVTFLAVARQMPRFLDPARRRRHGGGGHPDRIGGVQFSGRQWQKVALARIRPRLTTPDTANRLPALVVVDEPTSALDPQAEVEAFERTRQLTDLGTTVILITHRLGATAKADQMRYVPGRFWRWPGAGALPRRRVPA